MAGGHIPHAENVMNALIQKLSVALIPPITNIKVSEEKAHYDDFKYLKKSRHDGKEKPALEEPGKPRTELN